MIEALIVGIALWFTDIGAMMGAGSAMMAAKAAKKQAEVEKRMRETQNGRHG